MRRREVMLAGAGVALGAVRRAEAAEAPVSPGLIASAFASCTSCFRHAFSQSRHNSAHTAAMAFRRGEPCTASSASASQAGSIAAMVAAICKQCVEACAGCAAQYDKVPA